ncbi:MAG: DegV family protein [Anaerolineae bacterium]|nr:DegV family protein [Anaerolineae bacterium]
MQQSIALITDSTCDIPKQWRSDYDIEVVPLTIAWKEQTYLDGVDLEPEVFYRRLESDPVHPTTSQPSPAQFVRAYQQAADKGYQQAVVFTISSAMSGTIASARQAVESSPIPVTVIDGKNNSMGLGWQVIAAARARDAGGDLQRMLTAAENVRKNVAYHISLDTMTYLTRGGRIGDAVSFLDSVLKIKPLIYVKPDTGTVGASIPARSRKAGIEGLYRQFFRTVNSEAPLHITVLHNAAEAEALALAERVREEHHPVELFISIVSPILGTHTGPRAIALCGYSEDW